ncbi:dimethylsulfonioproprionate lyase family protein [Pseudomonas sp. DTU_2021_1001937_2_SI_NGA_ILE_001]|uniref:dimethylsulfonioproprionate lyase family protein n=1 Tax=Pseudomonas sp. DTU_2021_1001937_2_SI_NGA_ILE_001 TaxID=3077589 RepID=UPI0028FC129D|nr:dimethylsulfonioproprionate lyase family protein [Pseudomonas sp. DTU_2021_1001937_2_SI_NGA_ILE_001]WNW09854.1 dimethylsulfonioproprionate lyase family protein [Pseudomonas sp. DTU_2021_1001937_2_SI_NGA_ILE_001]
MPEVASPDHHAVAHARQLLDALAALLVSGGPNNAGIERCRKTLQSAMLQLAEKGERVEPPTAIRAWFDTAMADARGTAPQVDRVIDSIDDLLPHADWMQRQAAPGQDDHFVDRHRHAMLVGPTAPIACATLTLGVAVMAPQVTYPFHQHPPEEFYIVLSEGEWYQEGRGWWSPGCGGIVHNEPSIVHAMKSGAKPLLALWGLLL